MLVRGECPCGFEVTDLGECVKIGCKDCFENVGGICVPERFPPQMGPVSAASRGSAGSACRATHCSIDRERPRVASYRFGTLTQTGYTSVPGQSSVGHALAP